MQRSAASLISLLVVCLRVVCLLGACGALLSGGLAGVADADEVEPKAKAKRPARAPRRPAAPSQLGPPREGSLRDLGLQLDKLALRIAKTIEKAARDPDESVIDIYEDYGAKELKNRKRLVRAKDLVVIMVDPANSMPLRERARKALENGALRGDIELASTSKRRGMQERALFCKTFVVNHLKHAHRESRRLASELLRRWYKVNVVAAIFAYKVDEKKTWGRAISAWNKELKKQ